MIRCGLDLSDSGHMQVSGYIKHLLLVSHMQEIPCDGHK
jgi:hypothetical protein